LVPEWLNMSPLAPYIVAFGAAAVVHGGSGAFYVHLRAKRAGSDGRT
jgi:DNA-nicking Smr family endonuclease